MISKVSWWKSGAYIIGGLMLLGLLGYAGQFGEAKALLVAEENGGGGTILGEPVPRGALNCTGHTPEATRYCLDQEYGMLLFCAGLGDRTPEAGECVIRSADCDLYWRPGGGICPVNYTSYSRLCGRRSPTDDIGVDITGNMCDVCIDPVVQFGTDGPCQGWSSVVPEPLSCSVNLTADGVWIINDTVTCQNVNITVTSLNVTETGDLTLRNVTFRSGNVYVTNGGRLSYENSEAAVQWWLNKYLTIGGRVDLKNATLRANGSTDGLAGLNISNTGYFFVKTSHISTGEDSTNGYVFWVDSGSNVSFEDVEISGAGYSNDRYAQGLTINTTAINFTRVHIYDGHIGLIILDGANGTNFSSFEIRRPTTYGVLIRNAKQVNISYFNISSAIENQFTVENVLIEHGNISNSGDYALHAAAIADSTISDINFSANSAHSIFLSNPKNVTMGDVNVTENSQEAYGNAAIYLDGISQNVLIANTYVFNEDPAIVAQYALDVQDGRDIYLVNDVLMTSYWSRNIIFNGNNLTLLNTTITSNPYAEANCMIIPNKGNITVQWPLSILVTDVARNPLPNARANLYATNYLTNFSNTTGPSGFIRYLNVTEYQQETHRLHIVCGDEYRYYTNYTLNVSKPGYRNYSASFNLNGPNMTTVTLERANMRRKFNVLDVKNQSID